ncbi:MAG: hypothetical protein V7L29_27010 [Nostoc sp.]|uniref:hypothetical protein n=1 Tax=Nostoc sp. TaxID=1180 RepID=UPI002FEE9D53
MTILLYQSFQTLIKGFNLKTQLQTHLYAVSLKIGQATNIGGPNNNARSTEAGLETTSDKNTSLKAAVYGLQYATLSNSTLQNCLSPSLSSDF